MKVACVQMNSGGDIDANIATLEALMPQAAGARLVATPENVFQMEEPGRTRQFFAPGEHPGLKAAARLAKAHRCWLLVGSAAVKIDGSGKTANRSVLYDDRGEEAAFYDKIHLFDVEIGDGQSYRESSRILPGGRAVVAATPWAKLGLSVCYDVRFPQLYRALAKAGAEILAVPSAFTSVTGEAHWHVLLRARAIENGCFVIAPAQTGAHPGGRSTYGHALIVGPWGDVLADAGTQETVITADLDLAQVEKTRARIPSLRHDREFKG